MGLMTPEIKVKSVNSPVKVDRGRAGKFFWVLTARKLTIVTIHNPEQCSSILQFAASLSDVENTVLREEGLAISTRHNASRRRKCEAPESKEAETFSAKRGGTS